MAGIDRCESQKKEELVVQTQATISSSSQQKPPSKALISYSHDSQEHKGRVLALADRLRGNGVDCRLDQYEESPSEGWPRWMENQIQEVDFVLMVCTETYHRRVTGNEESSSTGLGVCWEGHLIYQILYRSQTRNEKFIPILFDSDDTQYIPTPLQSFTYYNLSTSDNYEDLYRRLTGQHSTPKPPLGQVRSLPLRERPLDSLGQEGNPLGSSAAPSAPYTKTAPELKFQVLKDFSNPPLGHRGGEGRTYPAFARHIIVKNLGSKDTSILSMEVCEEDGPGWQIVELAIPDLYAKASCPLAVSSHSALKIYIRAECSVSCQSRGSRTVNKIKLRIQDLFDESYEVWITEEPVSM